MERALRAFGYLKKRDNDPEYAGEHLLGNSCTSRTEYCNLPICLLKIKQYFIQGREKSTCLT
jgi:hypothetical protein